eukprot:360255-Chlamydomonas_euryale.AAC.7
MQKLPPGPRLRATAKAEAADGTLEWWRTGRRLCCTSGRRGWDCSLAAAFVQNSAPGRGPG